MTSNDIAEAGPDYGTGLILFGVLDVAVGMLYLAKFAVFLVLSLPAGGALSSRYGRGEVIATAFAAAPAAVFFLSVGFGSMAARRWARSLSVAFSAVWLAAASLVAVVLFVCLPRMFSALRSLAGASPIPFSREFRAYLVIGAVGVVLPAAYLVFYRSSGVKAECERRDPEERWSDRVPPAHLAAAVVLAIGSLLSFSFAFSSTRQLPLFGSPLGPGARAAVLGAAAIQGLVVWGICRGDRRAWPAAVAVMAIHAAANLVIAFHLAGMSLSSLAARVRDLPAESRAAIERLEPLHPLRLAAWLISTLSIAAFVFVAWTGFRAVRASRHAAGAG